MRKPLHASLSRRERQIMDILYRRGRATAADVMDDLTGEPTSSTVRTQLRVLEAKGHVRHEEEGLRYVYVAAVPRRAARQSALRHLVETFFDGSTENAVVALLGADGGRLSAEQLDRIADFDRSGAEGRWTMSLLIETTVRVSLVVVAALVAASALTRSSAALRHWLLTIGIACGAATPLLQLALPAWQVAPVVLSSAAPGGPHTPDVITTVVVQNAQASDQEAEPSAAALRAHRFLEAPKVVMSAWLAGVLISLLVLAIGLSRLSRMESAARPLRSGALAAMASDLKGAMGLRRPVRLLQSSDPTLLFTWGMARPRIILPADASAWPGERARVVLRHELAHIARGDWLAQMLAGGLRALFWFNPLLWIAYRRLCVEAERACDDMVLNSGVGPAEYASYLLELARMTTRRRANPALAMARASSLEGRIRAMLNNHVSRQPLRRSTRIATLFACLAVTVPVALAQNRLGTLSGTVVDQTNRAVPDSRLVLTSEATHVKHEARTDPGGHFAFPGLPSGDYQLAVQQPGFKTFKETVAVAGQDLTREIRLQIGSVHETLTVASGPGKPVLSDPDPQPTLEEARRRAQDVRRQASEKCGAGPAADGIGGQILPPVKLTDIRPAYPEALKARMGGVVTVDALIGTDGTVREVTAVSSPHPDLERAAIDAVRRWEFSTTYLNCIPVQVPMRVTVSFVTP